METILKIIEPYKNEIRKFLPDDLFPSYGFVALCILLLIFELLVGIEFIDLFPVDVKIFLSNIFNQEIGEKILVFWTCILVYYVVSELLFALVHNYIKSSIKFGNGNIFGVGIQIRKCVLIYFSVLLLIFPDNLSYILNNITTFLNEPNFIIGCRNIIFALWALIEIVGLMISLYTDDVDLSKDKDMNNYRIEELKKETVKNIISISGYLNNQNDFELRMKIVKQIEEEFDIIDRGIDLDDIIATMENERKSNLAFRNYDKSLGD